MTQFSRRTLIAAASSAGTTAAKFGASNTGAAVTNEAAGATETTTAVATQLFRKLRLFIYENYHSISYTGKSSFCMCATGETMQVHVSKLR